ncbi:serine/threonine-protein phosphatase [Nocardioides sp. TRM66260-LWL]|uniref:PP2C family protein-serine/threonine phosphatase n=1 Tax=Nocardioides sp. TRM66260-LWL TaxID=2874478 RepID=UPI001CC76F66|nr:PP2C family protein-serine/threonine phosphatase [Nocardioides sp. TRM66260-LWL]MBZ5735500.1 serine/threonine-protein phosphatase [Nocardioides sp. TRM66260-LWL]
MPAACRVPPALQACLTTGVLAGLSLLVVLVAIDVEAFRLAGAFSAAALLTSVIGRWRETAGIAVASVVVALLSGAWHDYTGTAEWWLRVGVCTLIAVLAVVGSYVRDQREDRLKRMTVIAETAQRAVLRSTPSAVGSVGVASRYVSASAEALVGGDLYEVAETPHGVRVIVGDVRGKGLPAVQTASAVLGAFRTAAFTEPDLCRLARMIDVVVEQEPDDEEFVTAVVAEFQGDSVRLVNCGHHAPLLVSDGAVEALDDGDVTVPLGLGSDPTASVHAWPRGARMLFFTDGLVEHRDRAGRFFDLDAYAPSLGQGDLEQALDRLVARLLGHSRRALCDDLALVLAENRA